MLPSHVPQDEKYVFVIDDRNGFYIIFATAEMLGRQAPVQPLWHREAGDERSLRALTRWVGVRRALWQEWGRLAEEAGQTAFYEYMRDLMTAQPIAECVGTVVQHLDDPRQVGMGEMLEGPGGTRIEELYRHRFASAAARNRFFRWLNSGRNIDSANALLQIAYSKGTAELGRTLDALSERAPRAHAERKRKTRVAA